MEYFDYDAELNSVSEFDVESFLQKSEKREQEILERQLERINLLLEERQAIHEETVTELESKLDWYTDRLEDLYRRGVDRNKEELKQQIEKLYRDLREQERQNWLDRQELEEERREINRELRESNFDDIIDLIE